MLAMIQSVPSLTESSSQADYSKEYHDYQVTSNEYQDNTQLIILHLLQEMQCILKSNIDESNNRHNRKQAVKSPNDGDEWLNNISKH